MNAEDCGICREIDSYESARMISDELPAASRLLTEIGKQFARCPACGALYLREWDDNPFVSGASDEERLFRLGPGQAEVLRPLFESGSADSVIFGNIAFYVGQLLVPGAPERVDRVVLALLCALGNANPPVREMAAACLDRWVGDGADRARLVREIVRRHEGAPSTPRAEIHAGGAELRSLIARCEALAPGGDSPRPRASAEGP